MQRKRFNLFILFETIANISLRYQIIIIIIMFAFFYSHLVFVLFDDVFKVFF